MSAAATEPQPIVDGRGATILCPRNVAIERENPEVLVSPCEAPARSARVIPNTTNGGRDEYDGS